MKANVTPLPKELDNLDRWGDLTNRPDLQKAVFEAMLRRLEDEGLCRYGFHDLAEVLFQDRLER